MDIKDLMKNIKNLTADQVENKLNELVRQNYRFSNLGEKNKELVLNLVDEYKRAIIRGEHISDSRISRDVYKIYSNRIKLGVTQVDLDRIKEILKMFKS